MALKHIHGRVIVKIDTDLKNWHTFASGKKIRLERGWENFNNREVQPVNAIVISAENIPQGSEILIHHNSIHDVNRIFDYTPLSSEAEADCIKYYSLPEHDCFAWRRENGELKPLKGFQFALRVFEPYKGILNGIPPKLMQDILYITTGKLAGNVCHVLVASDYEIVYQGLEGREERIIRIRHNDEEEIEREEIIAVNHSLTGKMLNGELFVGLIPSDAMPVKTIAYAD
jgi:hypothetical protein